jgi:hypothetical protein
MKKLLSVTLFLSMIAGTANAASYKPGSVGYVYEDCKQAIERGTNLEDIYQTYCGAFVEGYFAGASVSNWIQLPEPAPGDPCAAEKQVEYDRINNRICKNFPDYTQKDVNAGFMIRTASEIIARWTGFLKNTNKTNDALKNLAVRELDTLLAPGPFCDDLGKMTVSQTPLPQVNSALKNIEWSKYLDIQKQVTLARKYKQCRTDLESADGNKNKFAASWCGAEISGFIAGLHSTAHLQKNRSTPSPSCAKEIDRLYRSLDVTQSMCVKPDTDLTSVAEIFLRRFEAGITKNQGFLNSGNLGAVGYETIYRGFLCVNQKQ